MSDSSNENNTAGAIGWLLLRDGHAVPLFGLEPDALKRSCQHTIMMPEAELRHRRRLNAIVDTLGFTGDFGDYKHSGWPRFTEFLADHGCTVQRDLFADTGRFAFFGLPKLWGPNRRQLADRIQLGPKPSRVFLANGVNWEAWDARAEATRQRPFLPWVDLAFTPGGREQAEKWLLERRGEFDGQWGFMDDKLVADPTLPLVDKSYYDDAKRMGELRDKDVQRLQTAVRVFRSVFDSQAEGWVDVLPFNDKLPVLRAHDGHGTWSGTTSANRRRLGSACERCSRGGDTASTRAWRAAETSPAGLRAPHAGAVGRILPPHGCRPSANSSPTSPATSSRTSSLGHPPASDALLDPRARLRSFPPPGRGTSSTPSCGARSLPAPLGVQGRGSSSLGAWVKRYCEPR